MANNHVAQNQLESLYRLILCMSAVRDSAGESETEWTGGGKAETACGGVEGLAAAWFNFL